MLKMKIISIAILVALSAALTAARVVHPEDKVADQKDTNSVSNDDQIAKEDLDEIGSGIDTEASGSSGSGQEENDSPMRLPKPMQFPYSGFRGPVTIIPMEPKINRQKPFRRPCFFCFPRGRLGRVEVTAPGGPFLMNGFGNAGYGMEYPNMGAVGLPQAGPVYPDMGGGYPDMGGAEYGPGPFAGGPCCGGPSNGPGEGDNPMIFQELSEEPAKTPAKAVSDKPMMQSPKAMGHTPNKILPQIINKPLGLHHKAFGKHPNNGLGQVPMKGIMDEPAKKPLTGKIESQPNKSKADADKIQESKKPKHVEEWVNI